jgi:hypothetical protein
MKRAHDSGSPRAQPAPPRPQADDPRRAILGLPPGVGNREVARWARTLARDETKEKPKSRSVTVYLGDPRPKPPPPGPIDATMRATRANLDTARLIDKLDQLSDAELEKARWNTAKAAVAPGYPSGQKQEQDRLEAIEYVAAHRRLGALKTTDAAAKSDATQRRLYVRMLIEEGLSKKYKARTGGSFKAALADFTHTSEIKGDIEWFEREAKDFRKRFYNEARENARKMLDSSLTALGDVLTTYGLKTGSAVRIAREIYHGANEKEKVQELLDLSTLGKNVDLKRYQDKRKDLAMTVKDLKNHQKAVEFRFKRMNEADMKRTTGPHDAADDLADEARRQWKDAKAQLEKAWINAERDHQILAAFRHGGDVAKVDLGTLDSDPVQDEMREVIARVLPKMVDIIKVAWLIHIGPDQHGISPLSLPPVVAMTRASMFIPDGSIRAGIVKDMVDEASDEPAWMMIAAIALAIVTLLPTAGASAGLIGVAGAGLAAYSAAEEWQKYDTKKSLANTDLDLARSLSTEEPSLTGFAVSLVGLGMEALPLVGAFNKARRIKRLMNEGNDAAARALVRELNNDGARYGAKNLGDEAWEEAEWAARKAAAEREAAEREAAAAAKGGKPTEPTVKKTAEPPHPPPIKDLLNTDATFAEYKTEEELRKALHVKTHHKEGDPFNLADMKSGVTEANPMMKDLQEVIRKGLVPDTPNNRLLLEKIKKVYEATRDPKFVEESIVELWKEAGKRRMTVRRALEDRMAPGGKVSNILGETDADQFRKIIGQPEPIRDLYFASDVHGAHTHMFQEYMVDRILGPGEGRRFRMLISKATGPNVAETAWGKKERPFWSAVWDALFDDGFGKGHINHPETLGRVLQDKLGLPRWTPNLPPEP